ncbi:MAG: TolC family protein [bacterium]|nr:TolC family protein [bacterium]
MATWRYWLGLFLLAFPILVLPGNSKSEVLPSPLSLAWCLERAAARNPAIAEEQARADAAHARTQYADTLDDPRFRYEASNIPIGDLDFDSTPLSGHQLGLSQRIPFPGTLANRRDAAEAGARAAEHAHEDRKGWVASGVESAWAELGFAQRALEITQRNIELLRQLVRVAEAKYRVGIGQQQDVLRAQVELTALLDEQLGRTSAIERASAELGALLDLAPGSRFPTTEPLSQTASVPDLGELRSSLEERNPQLLSLRAKVAEAERLVRTTEFEGYPDFDFGVGYRVRKRNSGDRVNGDDFLGASVTVRLPIDRSKWSAMKAERQALLRRSQATYRRVRATLFSSLHSSHTELIRADSESALLGTGLVPQARQSLESSHSAYAVGRTPFLGVLDSQVRLLNAELRWVRAQADRRQAYAALEATAGETLR